ncbi:hypothetical protein DFJ74DRAFT_685588 [Hyaloraphidium curvatum]|nr:hypothetical protein DFJ74DRAFT_685588 [Hyaloraphidium curvatum]
MKAKLKRGEGDRFAWIGSSTVKEFLEMVPPGAIKSFAIQHSLITKTVLSKSLNKLQDLVELNLVGTSFSTTFNYSGVELPQLRRLRLVSVESYPRLDGLGSSASAFLLRHRLDFLALEAPLGPNEFLQDGTAPHPIHLSLKKLDMWAKTPLRVFDRILQSFFNLEDVSVRSLELSTEDRELPDHCIVATQQVAGPNGPKDVKCARPSPAQAAVIAKKRSLPTPQWPRLKALAIDQSSYSWRGVVNPCPWIADAAGPTLERLVLGSLSVFEPATGSFPALRTLELEVHGGLGPSPPGGGSRMRKFFHEFEAPDLQTVRIYRNTDRYSYYSSGTPVCAEDLEGIFSEAARIELVGPRERDPWTTKEFEAFV